MLLSVVCVRIRRVVMLLSVVCVRIRRVVMLLSVVCVRIRRVVMLCCFLPHMVSVSLDGVNTDIYTTRDVCL